VLVGLCLGPGSGRRGGGGVVIPVVTSPLVFPPGVAQFPQVGVFFPFELGVVFVDLAQGLFLLVFLLVLALGVPVGNVGWKGGLATLGPEEVAFAFGEFFGVVDVVAVFVELRVFVERVTAEVSVQFLPPFTVL
jgi:hypothetical protein